jgi:hypothetical protein
MKSEGINLHLPMGTCPDGQNTHLVNYANLSLHMVAFRLHRPHCLKHTGKPCERESRCAIDLGTCSIHS